MDSKPNHTIYVNNLNEKIKKEGENSNQKVLAFNYSYPTYQ